MDVVFEDGRRRIAVEVKAVDAEVGDLVRGLFQCVKYLAVLDAEASTRQAQIDCRTVLALGGGLPAHLYPLRAILGIDVREGLGTGDLGELVEDRPGSKPRRSKATV